MYKKLSKSGKGLFWIINILLLVLLIYCIVLIPFAGWFELIISGLGWIYILITIFAWFNLLPKMLYVKNKKQGIRFTIIAIIGIIVVILINFFIVGNADPRALPIIFIPAVLVAFYLVLVTTLMNSKKAK